MTTVIILTSILISIVWHEVSHSFTLSALGVPLQEIQIGYPVVYRRGIFSLGLIPFIGRVGGQDLSLLPKTTQAAFFASGPAGSLLLGIGAIWTGIFLNAFFLKMLGVVSLAVGVFNLIPVPPMDGYRLVALMIRVPCRVQVLWAVVGWISILMATIYNFQR